MPRYSLVAIILHWAIAALLAFQISVGWALEDLGARGFALYQWHKSVGITILGLTLLRIVVRYWKPRPARLEGGWQGALASGVHFGLYAFMLGAPLSGWALVSTAKVKVPTLLFGVLPLPHLPLPASAHELAEGGHGLIAWLGIALFLLHVAGALRHHFLIRDGLIWRMIPGRSTALLIILPALMLLGLVVGKAILPAPAAKVAAPVAASEASQAPAASENIAEPANIAAPAPDIAAANVTEAAPEAPPAPPPAWTVQPGGKIGFSVGNDGQTISGSFAKWTAAIVMDPDHPETADIRVTIDMASASVGDAYQDGMLPGDEFFAVAAHPTATFTAKGAEKSGANAYRATGTLSLKGVAKPQTIRFTLSGDGATRKVSGTATIARVAFGVGNGESSGGLAPQVALTFAFTARKKD
ncbi:MAG: polyisoprenoid-binding protein [Sphingobium sp.]|jgi:cytochrome b561/polyisoprenoid-binding protein YceI|uniref:YceI family protein n=1 Tax=Sphingobium sp. TaxID=1912891 RepID=UPI000C4041D5|nr:YceI family protein [Sphingobium sp.]MBU0660323.1 YceI family protein [Alphaproteobacteria bacterium]MBA4754136.1 YceI family protein [Sphingobium sp.]MBS89056.1 polyisoprenoid-binding protein [Sphingobium sp.]MBU0869108.1 YceI family protein [Alphaproteobacteria bacterium]MBU1794240.1 YceI family protein [Alphaproteobacteria bacterium]